MGTAGSISQTSGYTNRGTCSNSLLFDAILTGSDLYGVTGSYNASTGTMVSIMRTYAAFTGQILDSQAQFVVGDDVTAVTLPNGAVFNKGSTLRLKVNDVVNSTGAAPIVFDEAIINVRRVKKPSTWVAVRAASVTGTIAAVQTDGSDPVSGCPLEGAAEVNQNALTIVIRTNCNSGGAGGLPIAAIAGIVVGGVIFLVVVAAVIGIMVKHHQTKTRKQNMKHALESNLGSSTFEYKPLD